MSQSKDFFEEEKLPKKTKKFERKFFREPIYHDDFYLDESWIKRSYLDDSAIIPIAEIVKKITKKLYFFKWIKESVIINALKTKLVQINHIKSWSVIIDETDSNCDVFYILLRWKLWLYVNKMKIGDIDKISLVGEIWFINPEIKRTATVKTLENSFLMRFDRRFIDHLNLKDRSKIEQNFASEIASKVVSSNYLMLKVLKKLRWWNWWDAIVTEEIEKQIKEMVFHTVDQAV